LSKQLRDKRRHELAVLRRIAQDQTVTGAGFDTLRERADQPPGAQIFRHQPFVGYRHTKSLNRGADRQIHRIEMLIFAHNRARCVLLCQPQRPVGFITGGMQKSQR